VEPACYSWRCSRGTEAQCHGMRDKPAETNIFWYYLRVL